MRVEESFMSELESISSYISCSILVVDREGMITNCNKFSVQLLKTSEYDLIGGDIKLFLPQLILGEEKGYLTIGNKECICYQLPFTDENDKSRTFILIDDNFHEITEQIIDKYENALTNLSECILSVDRNGKKLLNKVPFLV